MGSCISKCKPTRKKNSPKKQEDDEEEDRVNRSVVQLQDKLVIAASESPPLKSPTPPPPAQKPQNPNPFLSPLSPSPSHSSCSSSSFSLSTNCPNSSSSSSSNPSLSSASSCASSISISKHNSSFSNEFLQSRLKENPPIVLLDPNKLAGNCVGVSPPSFPSYHHHHHHHPVKPKSPAAGPTQKRQRASSPNLTRQKSFRRDPVGPTLTVSANKPSSLRSPSPSRRFVSNGGAQPERNCKRIIANSKRNGSFGRSNTSAVSNSSGGYVKKENLKPFSDPNSRSRRSIRSPSMKKDSEICSLNRVVSRVDGITIGEERGHLSGLQDVEMLPVEDLNNPLIALDCFIFL